MAKEKRKPWRARVFWFSSGYEWSVSPSLDGITSNRLCSQKSWTTKQMALTKLREFLRTHGIAKLTEIVKD